MDSGFYDRPKDELKHHSPPPGQVLPSDPGKGPCPGPRLRPVLLRLIVLTDVPGNLAKVLILIQGVWGEA